MTGLDELSRTIGSIENELKTAKSHHEKVSASLDDLTKEVRALRDDFRAVKRVVEDMEPEVETLKTLRNRGIGFLVGAGLLGSGIGIGAWKAIEALVKGG